MSSSLSNIPEWVGRAPISERNFRRAVHVVLVAIAGDRRLSNLLCMKGGILMALHYDSPRFTTDIDFSTPDSFTEEAETEVVALLTQRLAAVSDEMGYDIDCRLQGWKVKPSRSKTYVSIFMSVGYAERGRPEHGKLMRGQSPHTVSLDYNFRESIPQVEEVLLGNDGTLRVYALPTLIAEKFRSLLQQPIRNRNRRQDVFDIFHLLQERANLYIDACRLTVLDDLRIKCADRDVPVDKGSLSQPEVREMAFKEYETLATEVDGDLPPFDEAFAVAESYYLSLPWETVEPKV
jgi:predicted nucleotidyltransferase component of viral defense system